MVSRRLHTRARKLLFVPVLAAGLTASPLPASADGPARQGIASSQGKSQAATTADPAAWGRPFGVQTGRRPR